MTKLTAEYILKHDSKPAHCFSAFVKGQGYIGTSENCSDYNEQLAKRRANELENMQWAAGYAEPGYTNPGRCILFANWNCFSRKVVDLLEQVGYAIEWSDEWTQCGQCGKAVRTSGDCYQWTPYYVIEEGEHTCLDCIDWESYLKSIEDNPHTACLPQCNPADYGYELLSDRNETGFHPGMNDDPVKMFKELEAQGKTGIVFRIDEQSQFYTTWQVWIKKEDSNEV